MRTYRIFKNNFSFESYLNLGNPVERKVIAKFRISDHNLEVERGRYKGLQLNDRICKLCNSSIEDEVHYLLECPSLSHVRDPLIDNICFKYKNFKNLNSISKFIWLMTSEDTVIIQFVYKLLNSLAEEKNEKLSGRDI